MYLVGTAHGNKRAPQMGLFITKAMELPSKVFVYSQLTDTPLALFVLLSSGAPWSLLITFSSEQFMQKPLVAPPSNCGATWD